MTKLFMFALFLTLPLAAQTPAPPKPAEPTVAELKMQLADAQQKIAELEQQLLEANIAHQMDIAPQVIAARFQAQQKTQQAKDAAALAHTVTENAKAQPAK